MSTANFFPVVRAPALARSIQLSCCQEKHRALFPLLADCATFTLGSVALRLPGGNS